MKNYRELQTCLDRSLGDLQVERERAEAIFNDVARSLVGTQGVPKQCLIFALISEGQAPIVSKGAKDFVTVGEDREWGCNLVFRIYKTGPRADYIHVVLHPTITFRDDTAMIGLAKIDISDQEIDTKGEAGDSAVSRAMTEMVTEGAAKRIKMMGGSDDRKIGFDID